MRSMMRRSPHMTLVARVMDSGWPLHAFQIVDLSFACIVPRVAKLGLLESCLVDLELMPDSYGVLEACMASGVHAGRSMQGVEPFGTARTSWGAICKY